MVVWHVVIGAHLTQRFLEGPGVGGCFLGGSSRQLVLHRASLLNRTCSLDEQFCFTDAAFKILNPMTVPRFFRLNSNNALIEFLLEVRRTLFHWWWELSDILYMSGNF